MSSAPRFTLEVFALRETLAGLASRQPCCPLLAGRGGTGSWPVMGDGQQLCQGWGIYWTGTPCFTQLRVCISAYPPCRKQATEASFSLPPEQVKPCCISFQLSWALLVHVTNSCSQRIININKAFNWNLIEKHFHWHSWQEPPRTNAICLPSTT